MLLLRHAFTQVLLHKVGPSHRDGFHTERLFDKGMLLDTVALTHRCFQHIDAFTRRCFKTQILTRKWFFNQFFLDANAFTHRCLYTGMFVHTGVLPREYVCTVLLYTRFFTHNFSYTSSFTQKYFDTHSDICCTRRYFDMACFLQTHACSFTRMFFRRFYAEIRLLTQRCFYTEMLSHTETLLHTFFLHSDDFT